jgi:hypothetical protein
MSAASPAVTMPDFQPAMRIVTAITNANPAVVTTSFAHQYISGTQVRLYIPQIDGMPQIAGIVYPLTVISPTTFSLPVDSTKFQAFTNNAYAQVIPVGELNSQFTAATVNILPYAAT